MRYTGTPPHRADLVFAVGFFLAATAASASSSQGPATSVAPVAVPAPPQRAPPPVTQRSRSLGSAVTSPLEDLNLKRVSIPEVLQRAVDQPYDVGGLSGCAAVAAEIGRLDAALGPDRDQPPVDRHMTAGSAAVELVRAGAEMAVPYRGWVRKLTGAARHEAQVQEAINAGGARRGYLKGVGMRMNCAPPAAPSWFKPAAPPKARRAPPPPTPSAAVQGAPAPRRLTITLPSWWPG